MVFATAELYRQKIGTYPAIKPTNLDLLNEPEIEYETELNL